MPDEKKRFTDYPTASSIEVDDYVMLDNGRANGTKKILASELGGGSYSVEILAGDMTATYAGAQPTYILPTTKTSLTDGKKWSDYDEIYIVTIFQQSATNVTPRLYQYKKFPVWALSHCEGDYGVTVTTTENFNGSASQGTRVCIYPDDSYKVDWYNYASAIAILGIKYN